MNLDNFFRSTDCIIPFTSVDHLKIVGKEAIYVYTLGKNSISIDYQKNSEALKTFIRWLNRD